MKSYRRNTTFAGILFLTAMAASLLGGGLLESVLSVPDYLNYIPQHNFSVIMGIILELVNGIAVIGIAVIMFPVLKRYNEILSLGYAGFRIIEALFCIVSAIIPFSILTISRKYLEAGSSDAAYYLALSETFISLRSDFTGLLIPVFFCLGALTFYYLLFKSRLIPRFISVWGFIAVPMILILNLLEPDTDISLVLALPIITNEIFLGIWLIVRGFYIPEVVSLPVE